MKKLTTTFSLLLLIGLVSCSSSGWSEEDKKTYLNDCARGGGNPAFCDCILNKTMKAVPNHSDLFDTDADLGKIGEECYKEVGL